VHSTGHPPLLSPCPINGIVAREGIDGSVETDVFGGGGVHQGLGVGGLVEQEGAVGGSDAVPVGSLEEGPVGPAHDKIAMVTISSGVAIREGKVGDVISEGASLEVELIEEGEDGNRVGLRANSAIIVANGRVGNVALVVGSVEVFPVPTRREVHLRPELLACAKGKSSVLATVPSINAHNGDGSLGKVRVVVCSPGRIASYHSETIRESEGDEALVASGPSRSIVASSLLVVMGIAGVLDHGICFSVGVIVVQLGDPVVAVVQPFVARSGCGSVGRIDSVHSPVESIATSNAMDMCGGDAREDDGVRPLDGQRNTVHCESITIQSTYNGHHCKEEEHHSPHG